MIDLRSDTVTQPTEAMRQVMAQAKVGDDVYGEDPEINELEHFVADLFGHEAALFVPSGTMANQIAINLHTTPGGSVLTQSDAHCFRFEAGAAAVLSGVQFDFLDQQAWKDPANIQQAIRSDNLHSAPTQLIVIENTHNYWGGHVTDLKTIHQIRSTIEELKKRQPLAFHCDGARIWNAAIALQCSEKNLAQAFDSVAACFSKGLGAPVGSILVGNKSFIQDARKLRKRLGGAMRQAGILAAAAKYALTHHRSQLAEDHEKTQMFLTELKEFEDVEIKAPSPITNMVYFKVHKHDPDQLVETWQTQGLRLMHLGQGWIRAVFHFQVSLTDVKNAIKIISDSLS